MKTAILYTACIWLIGISAFSQQRLSLIRDGLSINVLSRTWENTLPGDPKFVKANKEVKDEMIAARNEEIISGRTESHRNLWTYKVTKEHSPEGVENFKYSTVIIGKEHVFHAGITADTLYIYRSAGATPFSGDSAGKGFIYEGAQKVPLHIQLGDQLPVYEDLDLVFTSVKKTIVAGLEETGGTIWGYNALDKVDPTILNTAIVRKQNFYQVDARISRTDEILIAGKKYDAYVITSECWTKQGVNCNFKSSRLEAAKAEGKLERTNGSKNTKHPQKSQNTNEAGYIVSYREEWFVPELGIVKTRVYDSYNAIVSELAIISFK